MKTKLTKLAYVAGIVLAMTFVISCYICPPPGYTLCPLGNSSSSVTDLSSSSYVEPNSSSSNISSSSSEVIKVEFIDSRNNKKYKYVKIGNQIWMAENLNYEAEGSKCYDNLETNCDKYGRLYNWTTAMSVCPSGWHLPSTADWNMLYLYVDGTSGTSVHGKAGLHLKATSGWYDKGNGQDTYGFSALPGGSGRSDGKFLNIGNYGRWWLSESSNGLASIGELYYLWNGADFNYYGNSDFCSVRCLKD